MNAIHLLPGHPQTQVPSQGKAQQLSPAFLEPQLLISIDFFNAGMAILRE